MQADNAHRVGRRGRVVVFCGAWPAAGEPDFVREIAGLLGGAPRVRILPDPLSSGLSPTCLPAGTSLEQIVEAHPAAARLIVMADRIPPGGVPDVTFLCAGGPKTAPASGGAGLVIVAGEQVAGPSQSLLASRLRIAPELARRILWLAGARPAPVGGLILAGGRSARMGRDKVFLPAGGSTLTAGLHAALGRLCDEVIVVTSRARAAHFDGLRTVVDEQPDQGPLMAIASGLAAARHERNLVVACDIPTLDAALMARLLAESEDHQIVIPSFRDGGKQPLFGVYRKEVLGIARDLLGQGWRRPDDLLRACRSRIIPVASDDWYMNLNTPADYHAFLRRQAAGGPSAAG